MSARDEFPAPAPRSSLAGWMEVRRVELLRAWRERLGPGEWDSRREARLEQVVAALRSSGQDTFPRSGRRGDDVLRDCLLDAAEREGLSLTPAEVRVLGALSLPRPDLAPTEEDTPSLVNTLLDSVPVGLFFVDHELRYVRANRMLAEFNGVSVEDTLGRSLWEVIPALADDLAPIYRRVFATGQPLLDWEISGFTAARPGDFRHWRVSYYPVRNSSGETILVGGVLLDITELKRSVLALNQRQAELREAGQRLEAILETALEGIFTCDERGRIQRVNSAAGRIFGHDPAELIGRNVRRLLDPPYRRELGRRLLSPEGPGPGREWEVRGRHKDGHVFPLELSVGEIRLPQGRLFVGTVRDITGRKRAEEVQALFVETGTLLAQSLDVPTTLKSLARVVVTHLSDYCTVDLLDGAGKLQRLQVAARDEERLALLNRGRSWPHSLKEDSPLTRALREQQAEFIYPVTSAWLDGMAENPEHRALLEALGTQAVALIPLRARGHLLGLISFGWVRSPGTRVSEDLEVVQGVADRAAVAIDNARLYQEAQDAVRMREDVVAIVSHDLRNPLNAISLSASALVRRGDVDERTIKSAQRISAAAERASRLIRDMLDFTQARVGGIPIQRAPLDFHEHVRRVVDEVRMAWPGRFVHVYVEGEGRGSWDEGRLAQVVTNLVGNALQHSPSGAPVRVFAGASSQDVTLEVHNEGPPISSEVLPTLFEPYRRGAEAGERGGSLGLGLFITRQIILGHGGTLSVRSLDGEGTTFTVRLPRQPDRPLV